MCSIQHQTSSKFRSSRSEVFLVKGVLKIAANLQENNYEHFWMAASRSCSEMVQQTFVRSLVTFMKFKQTWHGWHFLFKLFVPQKVLRTNQLIIPWFLCWNLVYYRALKEILFTGKICMWRVFIATDFKQHAPFLLHNCYLLI